MEYGKLEKKLRCYDPCDIPMMLDLAEAELKVAKEMREFAKMKLNESRKIHHSVVDIYWSEIYRDQIEKIRYASIKLKELRLIDAALKELRGENEHV